MSTLLVIQHVPHERLGTFEAAFRRVGCSLRTLDVYERTAMWPAVSAIDGIVSMGGPQSVYEQAKYPFLTRELSFLQEALQAQRPILGVCLGAQLVAAALKAQVTKAPQKEIGWYPLMREPGVQGDPVFEPFGQTETVFQWHGDTFTLPAGAVRLASSPLCQESLAPGSGFHPESGKRMEQAFRYRDNVYGLQFHVEVTEAIIRAWMRTPLNAAELARLRGVIDPLAIRRQSHQHVERLRELSDHVASAFGRLVTMTPRRSTTARQAEAAQAAKPAPSRSTRQPSSDIRSPSGATPDARR